MKVKCIQSDKAETYKTLCPHWSSVRGIPECSVCIMENGGRVEGDVGTNLLSLMIGARPARTEGRTRKTKKARH